MTSIPTDDTNRFSFGANWALFLSLLDEERIAEAQTSLQTMLGLKDLQGKTFLDIGSGSGLFSLAARRLGARVHSFDYDLQSVGCTKKLKQLFFPEDPHWVVEQGSALDADYMAQFGKFDVVYSWGVLHHTGSMWKGIELALQRVAEGGQLFISIYNDQGRLSVIWKRVKQTYNMFPKGLRLLILIPALVCLWGPTTVRDFLRGKPFLTWRNYGRSGGRGMDPWRDVVDWVGGYPFEVAKPEEVFNFCRNHGFQLNKLKTCAGGLGCNEFVFWKK